MQVSALNPNGHIFTQVNHKVATFINLYCATLAILIKIILLLKNTHAKLPLCHPDWWHKPCWCRFD